MLPNFWRQLGFSFCFIFIGCVQVAFLKVTVKNLDLVKILMNALKCETFHRLHVHTCWVYHILMLASYINIVHIYYCHCQKNVTKPVGGTAAAAPPPFRPSDPALCGSCPLVTPYYCRLGDLLCYSCLLYLSSFCDCMHMCNLCFLFVFLCYFPLQPSPSVL